MNRGRWTSAIIFVIVCSLIFPIQTAKAGEAEDFNRLIEVYSILNSEHISGTSSKELTESAIYGMLWKLGDPYTDYFNPDEWEQYTSDLEQIYAGIGVQIAEDDQGIYIDDVFPNTPAAEAGVSRSDYIVEIDGKSIEGWSLDRVSNAVRGAEGTSVTLKLKRNEQSLTLKIERKSLSLSAVSTEWLGEGVGYLKLSTFSMDAADVFSAELSKLEERGLSTLIMDLRNNGGGYIHTAQQIAGRLIGNATLMHEIDRYGAIDTVSTTGGDKAVDYELVLLVNAYSASASELLAGALQDHGAAVVIGEQTYGKGSVQHIYPLTDGGVLKVTVEEYMTPKKRTVNGVGIKPDRLVIGSVPQLLAAIRQAGATEIRLQEDHRRLEVNGILFPESLDYIVREDRVYVASRTLGALVGSEVLWNGKQRMIEFGAGQNVKSFAASSPEVVQTQGKTYIELAKFKQAYPEMNWTWNGKELSIQY